MKNLSPHIVTQRSLSALCSLILLSSISLHITANASDINEITEYKEVRYDITEYFDDNIIEETFSLSSVSHDIDPKPVIDLSLYNEGENAIYVNRIYGDSIQERYRYGVVEQYEYDDIDRQKAVVTAIDGVNMARIETSYDDKGRVASTAMSDLRNSNLNALHYSYLTNGTMKSVVSSSDRYAMTLGYTTGMYPSYSGNVASMSWKGNDGANRIYNYRYDKLNRLTLAGYNEANRSSRSDVMFMGTPNYSTAYSYDMQGNVMSIHRKGLSSVVENTQNGIISVFGDVDKLTLGYNGNQLKDVSDSAPAVSYTGATDFNDGADEDVEYEYDDNGNMTVDRNRGIAGIIYNRLNLPVRIEFDSGHAMENSYDADGNLVQRLHRNIGNIMPAAAGKPGLGNAVVFNPVDTVKYAGPWQYANGSLDRINIPSGYIKNGNVYFYITDYQGNIRQVWNATTDKIVQDNHYYPYGTLFGESASTLYLSTMAKLAIATSDAGETAPLSSANGMASQSNASSPDTTFSGTTDESTGVTLGNIVRPTFGNEISDNSYRYGGKEWLTFRGLNSYDFTARLYDPALGRFHSPDPLNASYPHLSPHLYCAANPINATDPTGMKWDYDGLSDEERQMFEELKQRYKENAELEYIFDELEKSDNTYHLRYGDSLESLNVEGNVDNPSIYFEAIKDKGGTLYISKNNPPQLLNLAEDLFHCFQHDKISMFKEKYNYEFEAKLFAGLVYQTNPSGADMRSVFVKDIIEYLQVPEMEGNYGIYFKTNLSSQIFNEIFINKLDSFVNFNIQNHIGNINYRTPSKEFPRCLLELYKQFKIP